MGNLGNFGDDRMDYSTYVPNYEEVMTLLIKMFNLPMNNFTSNPPLFQLKQSILNCFVNIPVEFYRILVVIGEVEKTLRNLFDILEFECHRTSSDGMSVHMTLLVVVQQLLAKAPEVREYAFKRLFPDRDLNKEAGERLSKDAQVPMDLPNKGVATTGNLLVKLMTSPIQSVNYVATELIFQLCGEDADKLIRLTGFGNAAGLLAMRGLYGMGGVKERDTAAEFRAMQKTTPVSPDKIPELRKAPDGREESEEEKEDRLVENFQRLVDSGVVQLVRKDEKKDGDEKKT
jgi:hypothetical protein